jgi:hypothetical protein
VQEYPGTLGRIYILLLPADLAELGTLICDFALIENDGPTTFGRCNLHIDKGVTTNFDPTDDEVDP